MPHISGADSSQGPPHHLRAGGLGTPGPRFFKAKVLAVLGRVQSPKITHLRDAPGSRCLLAWCRCATRRG
jgi:hypothetical protein